MMEGKQPRITNRAMLVILAALLLLSLGAAGATRFLRPAGAQVKVTVDGELYGTYDLHQDQTVRIAPADGSWHNTLQIWDGRAAVTESDCANQICVHTPPLQEDLVGIIVCLPHGVAVELTQP